MTPHQSDHGTPTSEKSVPATRPHPGWWEPLCLTYLSRATPPRLSRHQALTVGVEKRGTKRKALFPLPFLDLFGCLPSPPALPPLAGGSSDVIRG